MTDSNSTKVEQVGTNQHVQSKEGQPGDSPGVSVRWAAQWTGATARCLLHEQTQDGCVACSRRRQAWSLFRTVVTSLTELLYDPGEGSDSVQTIVLGRDNELEVTLSDKGEPLLTLAIPAVVDITAAQAWMQRWLTLRTGTGPPRPWAS